MGDISPALSPTTKNDYAALAAVLIESPADDAALKAAITDALADAGQSGRVGMGFRTLERLLKLTGLKVGRKAVASWLAAEVKAAAAPVYESRRDRETNPDGTFDSAGRWYPSRKEDADDFTRGIRSPSRAWPYSYMVAARTKKHVVALVEAGVMGYAVPDCVQSAADRIQSALLSTLKGV